VTGGREKAEGKRKRGIPLLYDFSLEKGIYVSERGGKDNGTPFPPFPSGGKKEKNRCNARLSRKGKKERRGRGVFYPLSYLSGRGKGAGVGGRGII